MGRQINFFMDDLTENNFLESVEREGFKFLYEDSDEGKLVEFNKVREIPFKTKKILWLYIYKDTFGEIKRTRYANFRIDTLSSPVIEYQRTFINEEKKQINIGRLWIESKYSDKGALIKKSDEFIGTYELLCKWIKKNVPRNEVIISGLNSREYIADTIKGKLDDGYILRE